MITDVQCQYCLEPFDLRNGEDMAAWNVHDCDEE